MTAATPEFTKFSKRYRAARGELDTALTELRRRLTEGIKNIEQAREKAGLPKELFRIRLTEARTKDCDSLYRKVTNDKELSLAKALDSEHVRDLLGARLVCHNLTDVQNLVDLFKQAKWPGLEYVEPQKGEKNWLHDGHPESRYRGWHINVRWKGTGGDYRYAEVQIRTLLQDAWATFMHDDVYKRDAERLLSPDLLQQTRDLSDVLYQFDRMFENIRRAAENAPVMGNPRIHRGEALAEAMFLMASLRLDLQDLPQYAVAERQDTYVVSRSLPRYTFRFTGRAHKASDFTFLIGGDTPSSQCKIIKFEDHCKKSTPRRLKAKEYSISSPTPNVVKLVHNGHKRQYHDYLIECTWKGVFEEGREYIWCPWAELYGGAKLSYTLRLKFEGKPKREPRLFKMAEYDDLRSILDAYAASVKAGIEPKRESDIEFLFSQKKNGEENFICLFEV